MGLLVAMSGYLQEAIDIRLMIESRITCHYSFVRNVMMYSSLLWLAGTVCCNNSLDSTTGKTLALTGAWLTQMSAWVDEDMALLIKRVLLSK
jgi:hypothetical protein